MRDIKQLLTPRLIEVSARGEIRYYDYNTYYLKSLLLDSYQSFIKNTFLNVFLLIFACSLESLMRYINRTYKRVFVSIIKLLFIFSLLYFIQGGVIAFFSYFHKPYLNELGFASNQIGLLMALIMLPFILKVVFGLVSDRLHLFGMGNRKPYMIIGLLIGSLSFLSCVFISPLESFYQYALAIFMGSLGVALFDSATDGHAIESVDNKDYGVVQTSMISGKAMGIIILSLIFGHMVQFFGAKSVFIILSIMCLLPLWFVLKLPTDIKNKELQKEKLKLKDLDFLFNKTVFIFLIYAVTYSFISFGLDGLITYFLKKEFFVSDNIIGNYGSARGMGAVLGAILAGTMIKKKGLKFSAFSAAFLLSLGSIMILTGLTDKTYLFIGILWGVCWSYQETNFMALSMRMADKKIPASSFAFFMIFSNLGTTLGEGILTSSVDKLGFKFIFMGLSLLAIILVPLLLNIFSPKRASLFEIQNEFSAF